MAKRLGDSPLARRIGAAKAAQTPTKQRRQTTTLAIGREIAERARDAAHWNRESLRALIERATLAEIDKMERERGEVFPPRPR